MQKPIASHTMSRHQFSAGNENISTRQQKMPAIGTNGTQGDRKGRSASGCVLRMMSTAEHTMTKASSVPILVSSASTRNGRKVAIVPTNKPVRIVDFHGVRNFGWTA